ncbi:MAG: hypothetical protein ABR543_11550 [Gemmatimonadaceae bacterium]
MRQQQLSLSEDVREIQSFPDAFITVAGTPHYYAIVNVEKVESSVFSTG